MKGIVIFADAYPRIKGALYVIKQNYRKSPITIVVVGNPDLLKFFEEVSKKFFNNEIKLVFLEIFHPDSRRATTRGLKRIFYILPDIIRERRHLKRVFGKYLDTMEGSEVFLSSRSYLDVYAAERLRKKNRLVFISSHPTQLTPSEYSPRNISDLALLAIYKLTYGNGMVLGELPQTKGIRQMSVKFLRSEFDQVIDGKERDEMLKDFQLSQFKIFDTSRYRVIYFDEDLISTDFIVDKDTFRSELAEIFAILREYFAESEMAFKYHPGFSNNKTVTIGDILPDYIPAELLYDDDVKLYVGAFSAAIANVERGLAVSILELLSLKNEQTKRQLKEVMQRASSRLLFPKSLDEFEKILVNINEQTKA